MKSLLDLDYTPIEHKEHPGFYRIPGFSNYLINPTTIEVMSLKWGKSKILKWAKQHEGYCYIDLLDDSGYRVMVRRHRLLAMMFIRTGVDPAKFKDLQVNHMNGICGDDRLCNLEWCTASENVIHAHRLGKCNYAIPCKTRDIDDGSIREFSSVIECARVLGFNRDMILYRLDKGDHHIFPERKQYKRASDDTPWYIPKNVEMEYLRCNPTNQIQVRILNTGDVITYDKNKDAASALGVAESTLSTWLDDEGQPVWLLPDMKTYVQIKYGWDLREWRPVDNPIREYYSNNKVHQGVITTDDNGTKVFYPVAKMCANANGLKTTTLNMRLKENPNHRWKDGLRYERYDPEKDFYAFSL